MAKKRIENTGLTGTESAKLLSSDLVDELRGLIQQTRVGVARAVNSALVNLYWQIGTRIRTEVLRTERADYGKQICSTLSNQFRFEK